MSHVIERLDSNEPVEDNSNVCMNSAEKSITESLDKNSVESKKTRKSEGNTP